MKTLTLATIALCATLTASAQYTPELHGTIRGKYEYQTEQGEGRFQVRNARFSITGKVIDAVAYKAEIDLSDEGRIRMLDAYTRITPWRTMQFTIGQMRVPFTIDAHRSPHQQYFANRSFIAKQVGNVRDVGATLGYTFNVGFPIILEAGMFNGSGLTDQKDFWTSQVNFSAKAQLLMPRGYCLSISAQKTVQDQATVMMYDAGAYYHAHKWHIEAEYLYKTYGNNAFGSVHTIDAFVCRDIAVAGRKPFVRTVSPLVRYDFMSDHSDGSVNADTQSLMLTDYKRSRITAGVTLSLATKPFISDIRINFEKYLYRHDALPKASEQDKIVVEFMTRF